MLNIRDLEKRWLHYKIRTYVPYIIIAILLCILFIITIIFFPTERKSNKAPLQDSPKSLEKTSQKSIVETLDPPKKKELPEPITMPQQVAAKKTIATQAVKVATNSQHVKLQPSLDFMKKMSNSANPYYESEEPYYTREKKITTPKPKVSKIKKAPQTINQVSQKKTQDVVIVEQTKQLKQQKINIKRQNTQNDIYDIIKRFKKNNNPALSLFVAKKYYELGNYRQAYNYALMTNRINKDIESSWIIFAKSLVKLGKKEKAITTLKKYTKHTKSNRAEILLNEILSGKFK